MITACKLFLEGGREGREGGREGERRGVQAWEEGKGGKGGKEGGVEGEGGSTGLARRYLWNAFTNTLRASHHLYMDGRWQALDSSTAVLQLSFAYISHYSYTHGARQDINS